MDTVNRPSWLTEPGSARLGWPVFLIQQKFFEGSQRPLSVATRKSTKVSNAPTSAIRMERAMNKCKEYTRQELCHLVWTTPMVKLAKEFGLPDVGPRAGDLLASDWQKTPRPKY
jgi:hypothetical protein